MTFSGVRSRWWISLAALLIVPLLTVPATASGSAAVAPAPRVSFPADESPHNVKNEWWYYTGHLSGKDAEGVERSYGYELTFFRHGLGLFPHVSTYWSHFAVTDLNRSAFRHDSRTTLTKDVLPPGGGHDMEILGWRMVGANGENSISATSDVMDFGLKLDLTSLSPPALHGDGGLIPFGEMGSSFYYSQTNLKTTGTIVDHGTEIKVSGQSWFDHQWGNFKITVAGWDWFSIQLSDHTQYMVYVFRDGKGSIVDTIATQVRANGETTALGSADISLTPIGTWKSPETGYTYDSGWRLKVPDGEITVTPRQQNQELASSLGKYWEGACSVTGTHDGRPVTGLGYTELLPPYPHL